MGSQTSGVVTLVEMLWVLILVAAAAAAVPVEVPEPTPPHVLLITLDTTRADAVGFAGSADARTPVLDRLAALGVHYESAVAPAPLTLPSHATLLTGLDPPLHGVRSNGAESLGRSVPTMASIFAQAGWTTAAFVASRVLDHRFGLDRGFEIYNDSMVAERVGEYGYPERDARAVTDAAIEWLSEREAGSPIFLWVHYYDPHAPYLPPGGDGGTTERAAYLGEVSFVDSQIGRLLPALPGGLADTIIVVVGDHGEALGDHGEDTHGIFLYRATLEVPLLVVSPGLPAGRSIAGSVALRQVAPTILQLAGLRSNDIARLQALPAPENAPNPATAIYAEATMPEWAYGWAPLRAVLFDGLKYIDAPRPELYDVEADPAESHDLSDQRPEDTRRLAAMLAGLPAGRDDHRSTPAPEIDAQTRAALHTLGYAGGTTANDGLDPKDGIGLLRELETATRVLRAGDAAAAVQSLGGLAKRNPANARLQTRYGEALLASGEGERALAAYKQAVELVPRSEFARQNLGDALAELGKIDAARAAYHEAIEINPRWAPPWLHLADLAPEKERAAVLRKAASSGVDSVTVYLRLAEAELEEDPEMALSNCRRIGELAPLAAEGALCLGQVYLALDMPLRATPHLRRATVLGRGTDTGEAAARLLKGADPR